MHRKSIAVFFSGTSVAPEHSPEKPQKSVIQPELTNASEEQIREKDPEQVKKTGASTPATKTQRHTIKHTTPHTHTGALYMHTLMQVQKHTGELTTDRVRIGVNMHTHTCTHRRECTFERGRV